MEYIDIFDENNNPTGIVKEKKQAHEDGDFHRTAHIWIINDKNEILLQYRSAEKDLYPNTWDCSFAGHIDAGESSIANKIDFGGKIIVISLSIPVISTTLETLTKLLP